MKKILLSVVMIFTIHADKITLHNQTAQKLFAAIYYVPLKGNVTLDSLYDVPSNGIRELDRPRQKIATDRVLLVMPEARFQKSYRTKKELYALGATIAIGALQGKSFYVDADHGLLRLYTAQKWKQKNSTGVVSSIHKKAEQLGAAAIAAISENWLIQKANSTLNGVVASVTESFIKTVQNSIKMYWDSPHKGSVATVYVGSALSEQERTATEKRKVKNRQAAERAFGSVTHVPKIAVIASGGGYRAMLFALGFLVGAEKIGLLDMVTWMSVLSGSTWAMGTWLTNCALKGHQAPHQFREQFLHLIQNKKLEQPISLSELRLMSDRFIADAITKKPFTSVNLYGAALANRLFENFGNRRHAIVLSDQASLINSGNYPIPLYTAVNGEEQKDQDGSYYWYSFTPWDVSLEPAAKNSEAIMIPTWGYGRRFAQGSSVSFAPEESLGFQLGTYGSAYAADIERMFYEIQDKIPIIFVRQLLEAAVLETVSGKRLTWASILNFSKDISQSPFKDKDTVRLVDAGLHFNLPYPPVSGIRPDRKPDIIIFVDASDPIRGGGELKHVIHYAKRKGLSLPNINLAAIDKKGVSIFTDSNPATPVVIYVPNINDANQAELLQQEGLQQYKELAAFDAVACVQKGVCNTFNFKYTYDQAMKLSMLAEFNLIAYKDDILNAIKQRATA